MSQNQFVCDAVLLGTSGTIRCGTRAALTRTVCLPRAQYECQPFAIETTAVTVSSKDVFKRVRSRGYRASLGSWPGVLLARPRDLAMLNSSSTEA